MQYRRFGRTELQVSVLTFGGMRIPTGRAEDGRPGTDEQLELAARVMSRAFEVGINHFETARNYGTSEEHFGLGLKQLPREKVILTTKIGPTLDCDGMARQIEDSLKRLQVDYLDNFDIHGINTPEHLAVTLKRGGCLKAVRRFMDQGLIRHLGFSTHGPTPLILAAMDTGEFESVNLHYYYTYPINRVCVARAAQLDMGLFIISPTDKGG